MNVERCKFDLITKSLDILIGFRFAIDSAVNEKGREKQRFNATNKTISMA